MSRDDRYFYSSGAISLTFFFSIILLFFYSLTKTYNEKTYALTKENFVSISVELAKEPTTIAKKDVQTPIFKEEPTPTPKEEPKPIETPKKDVNIGNLFSSVVTKDLTKDTKKDDSKVDKRVSEEMQRKQTQKTDNKQESLSSKVSSLNLQKSDEKNTKTSAGSEVNEYLAKIHAMVYDSFYPPSSSQGKSVKVVVELDALGKMIDFRVLNYSDHSGLNDEVDKMKSRLAKLLFPKNPDNKTQRITIILLPEEKF